MENPMKNIQSPCINVCQLHNNVCIGCFRTREEIAGWSSLPNDEKLVVLSNIETRKGDTNGNFLQK